MTTETEQPQDFAAFEAQILGGEPDPVETETTEETPEVNDEAEPLELTEDDELVEGEEEETAEDKKPRHKSAKQRIDEITKARREAERERDELRAELARARSGNPAPAPTELKAPDPDEFEFGEADPKYIEALTDYKVDVKLAEREARAKAEESRTATAETLANLDTSWTEQEAKGAEKYEDFAEAIDDFRENAPCPPLMAAAIQGSPVGADVAYHFAKNQLDAELIAADLAVGDDASLLNACTRFGEIEGRFLTEKPARPGANAGPLDMAHYRGQLKGYAERQATGEKPKGKVMTDAPEPARHTARGASGKFGVDDDTSDFKAFEKKIMGGRR